MKRILLLANIIWAYGIICAQSVIGIPFGSTYATVQNMLENRVGKYSVYEYNGSLHTGEISVGDYTFELSSFEFQQRNELKYFNYAMFQESFRPNDVDIAKHQRDYLFSLLSDKYGDDTDSYINDQGFKCYEFGTNPKDPNKWLGYITLYRGETKGGKRKLFLILEYGPIHYFDSSEEF